MRSLARFRRRPASKSGPPTGPAPRLLRRLVGNAMADDASFLGAGWTFPPLFAAGGAEVHIASGVEDIEQSLTILLRTRRGERVMQDNFGCELSEFVFGALSQGLIGRARGL